MYLFNYGKKIILEQDFGSLWNELLLKLNTLKWNQKYEEFNEYYTNEQWGKVIQVAGKTLQTGKADQKFHRKLANAYIQMNNEDKADWHMRKAFSLNNTSDLENIIDEIEASTFGGHRKIHSQFAYLGGEANLGFIEHIEVKGIVTSKYLTKIVPIEYPFDHFAKKERYFHQEVRMKYPVLQPLTLEIIDYAEMKEEQLLLMTFPKLINNGIGRENFADLIRITEKISVAIPASKIKKILKVTDKGKAYQLASLMHKPSTHAIIFKSIRSKIKDLYHRDELEQVVAQMEAIILGLKLYKEINPAEDYVFCHGDLNESNIIYNKKEANYFVIDWSSYGLGLKGYDLARLFADSGVPFSEINEFYLTKIRKKDEENKVNQIFFVYHLFIFWIDSLDLKNVEEEIAQNMIPAVNYVKELMA